MKRGQCLKFSGDMVKDMSLIAKYEGFKLSDWLQRINSNFDHYVQKKKATVINHIEGQYVIGKMTDSEYRKIMSSKVPKSLIQERVLHKKEAEIYRENARKALLMNIKV
ncbi:hypothetical protein HYW20_07010 [Candidatus Woesearchaeota archaeon]|nr:hypothetical protein [Candidatus Woesearchaeota archaeon]